MSFVHKLKQLYKTYGDRRHGIQQSQEQSAKSGPPNTPLKYGLWQIETDAPSVLGKGRPFEVDVVAVHGLVGDTQHSWSSSNGKFWLRDLLPYSIPGIRVYCFEYSPDIYFDPSFNGLLSQAVALLAALDERKPPLHRPVMILCHSIGGLLVKSAFNLAQDGHSTLKTQIFAIAFLGTPHRGSSFAQLPAVFGNIVNCAYNGSQREALRKAVHHYSPQLSAATEDFSRKVESLGVTCVSFYEENPTPPVDHIVVDRESASLAGQDKRNVSLQANHWDICRFDDADSKGYEQVVDALFKIMTNHVQSLTTPIDGGLRWGRTQFDRISYHNAASKIGIQGQVNVHGDQNFYITTDGSPREHPKATKSPSEKSFTQVENNYLLRLSPNPLYGREGSIDEQSSGTLKWLEADPVYRSWCASESAQTLVVTGHSGCGKSVLASYIRRSLSESLATDTIVCRYFFDGTTGCENELCILTRSLIHQIVTERHKLVKPIKKAMDRDHGQILGDIRALWDLFRNIIASRQISTLIIIIDAVDECEDRRQEWIVQHFMELQALASHLTLKILITSKPHCPAAAALNEHSGALQWLRLELKQGEIEQDIGIFIHDHTRILIRDGRCPPQFGPVLQNALQEKAEATFLWVSLAISLLYQRRFLNRHYIDEIMTGLPPKITDMYDSLLSSVPSGDRFLAARILCLIRTCSRPLTLAELNIMVNVIEGHPSSVGSENLYNIGRMQEIESLLRGLVKTSDTHVVLCHHTVKDYLSSDKKSDILSEYWNLGIGDGHGLILRGCMRYLALNDFETDMFAGKSPTSVASRTHSSSSDFTSHEEFFGAIFEEPADISASLAKSIALRYELFDYAARYWFVHYSQYQNEANEELERLAVELCRIKNPRNWFQYLTILEQDPHEYPSNPDALTLACRLGHSRTLRILMSPRPHTFAAQALYWASRNGHSECVEALLSLNAPFESWSYYNGHSPLSIAAARGHYQCVRTLLSNKANVNSKTHHARTALSFAAGAAQLDIISCLLDEVDVVPDLADQSGATPLFWAVSANSLQAVKQLLGDLRINPDHHDLTQRNALSWACEYGFADIVLALVRDKRVKANHKDSLGCTPLIHAVRTSSLDTIKHLSRYGRSSVLDSDLSGRNALSWAARNSDPQVLQYLLRKDPNGANAEDQNGWTPLAWTLDPPERVQNAKILLQYVSKEISDQSGLAIFVLCISWRSYAIAQLLISENIFDVNTKSSTGRAALSYAAEAGHMGLVEQLLANPHITIDSADREGFTACSFAQRAGHDQVCNLIQNCLTKKELKHAEMSIM